MRADATTVMRILGRSKLCLRRVIAYGSRLIGRNDAQLISVVVNATTSVAVDTRTVDHVESHGARRILVKGDASPNGVMVTTGERSRVVVDIAVVHVDRGRRHAADTAAGSRAVAVDLGVLEVERGLTFQAKGSTMMPTVPVVAKRAVYSVYSRVVSRYINRSDIAVVFNRGVLKRKMGTGAGRSNAAVGVARDLRVVQNLERLIVVVKADSLVAVIAHL